MLEAESDILAAKSFENQPSRKMPFDVAIAREVGTILQLDGVIQACNQEAAGILGLTMEQLLGCTSLALAERIIHEDGSAFANEKYPGIVALKTGKPCDMVIGLYKPNGELIWLLLNSQPLFQAGETKPYGVVTTFSDITATKSSQNVQNCSQPQFADLSSLPSGVSLELALLEKKRRFSAIFNHTFQFTGLLKPDGTLLEANQPSLDFIGASAQEVVDRPFWETPWWTTPAIGQQLRSAIAAAATGEFVRYEVSIPNTEGKVTTFDFSLKPVKDETGQVVYLIFEGRDITKHKQIEQRLQAAYDESQRRVEARTAELATTNVALEERETLYRTLADTMPQLFWTTQPDGYHDYFNQRWYEYTGMTLEQTQGWGWSHLLHPDDRQRCLDIWNESLRTGKEYNIEYRFQRAYDGQYRWFLGRAFPLRDELGRITRWFGSCTDIHDQKCALEERDRALAQEQAARAEAEKANRIKDEFLAILSHELRSPLNPILGWAKLLKSHQFDQATTARALDTIERNAKLQAQLIEDLLDVSRILRGKLNLNASNVNLVTTIEAALETVRLAAEAKSIQIHMRFDSQTVSVWGDPARLQQVVWNLLSNAVKFTPNGGRVEVSLSVVDSSSFMVHSSSPSTINNQQLTINKYAQITISDTGKGITPDFLPYVFDYFRQADSSITRQFGGLGLGLAIVKHLVELHGGIVQAYSAGEGQGATFTVRLPLLEESRGAGDLLQNRGASHSPLTDLQVLVVDDDADMREFLAFVLQQHGATVKLVASARDAIATLTQSQPDIILSDLGMPEIDGYSLMRQIRALTPDRGGQIPAIALTAYAGETYHKQVIAAGFQKYLTKPIEPSELVTAIARLAKRD